MNKGYVQIPRRLLDSWIYQDAALRGVFIHLLLSANWDYGRSKGMSIEPGQLVTSQNALAKELQMSRQEIRTVMKNLEKGGAITCRSTNHGTLITIENSWIVGLGEPTINQQLTNKSTNKSTQVPTNHASAESVGKTNVKTKAEKKSTNKSTQVPTNRLTTNEEYQNNIYSSSVIQKLIEFWNSNCKSFPKVRAINPNTQRYKAIKGRIAEYSIDDVKTVFQNAEDSDFLSGRNGKWNRCNIDWLLKPNNFVKVLEGNYKGNLRTDYEEEKTLVLPEVQND